MIKINRHVVLMGVLLLLNYMATAQKNNLTNTAGIVVEGKIAGDIYDSSAIISIDIFKSPFILNKPGVKNYQLSPDMNGHFKIILPAFRDLFYARINYIASKSNLSLNDFYNFFLLAKGDSIFLTIGKEFKFSGRGAEKLNCMYEIKQVPDNYSFYFNKASIASNIKDSGSKHHDYLKYYFKSADTVCEIRLKILEKYQTFLPPLVRNIIAYDCIGKKNIQLLKMLKIGFRSPFSDKMAPVGYQYYSNYFARHTPEFNMKAFEASMFFPRYLMEKEGLWLGYYSKPGFKKNQYSFGDFYKLLKQKYKGAFLGRLITESFIEYFWAYQDAYNYLADALKIIKQEDYRTILTVYKERNLKGVPAPDFVYTDTLHKKYQLADFKGKALIIDFWYRGCTACAHLKKQMEPIEELYANNTDIVFVSVNVDQQRDNWIKGIKEGKYTSPKSTNLSLIEEKQKDPFLLYYNVTGYPRMIIIDKAGKLVSSNPPWPKQNGEQLIELINAALLTN
jgi:thioredoxin-related protein